MERRSSTHEATQKKHQQEDTRNRSLLIEELLSFGPLVYAEHKNISPIEATEEAKELGRFLSDEGFIVYPTGATGGIGAGHLRQAIMAQQFYESLKVDTRLLNLEMQTNDPLSIGYSYLQRNPKMYEIFTEQIYKRLPLPVLNGSVHFMADPQSVVSQMQSSGDNLDPKRKRLFVTTHAKAAISVIRAIQNGSLPREHTYIAEDIPDVWNRKGMGSMTSHETPGENHIMVVHDLQSALAVLQAGRRSRIVPWGTNSNPYFLTHESQRKPAQKPHLLFELSGNPIPGMDTMIVAALRGSKEMIEKGEVRITVHTMHHPESYKKLQMTINELGLSYCPFIRVMGGDNLTMEQSIRTREQVLIGNATEGYEDEVSIDFSVPDVRVAKGGEVPLEDSGDDTLVYTVWGKGHEEDDIMAGVREHRTIDIRDIAEQEPEKIVQFIVHDYKKRLNDPNRPNPKRSYSHLAPKVLFFPDRYPLLQQVA